MAKAALVVGGSGGIGSEIVRRLIQDGFTVGATYCRNKGKAEKLAVDLGKKGFSLYPIDVTSAASVKKVIDEIVDTSKAIDVLVFCVSPSIELTPFFAQEWKSYERHWNVQVHGLFNVVKCLEPQIKAKHKTKIIVLLTEACVGKPPSRMSDYISAKYSLMGLAKSLAVELGRYHCSVNMISPGITDTPLISNFPPKWIEMTAEGNPLGRITKPQDIAGLVSFLASESADYLNGAHILVNGGGNMS